MSADEGAETIAFWRDRVAVLESKLTLAGSRAERAEARVAEVERENARLREAFGGVRWNVADRYDPDSPVLVERESWRRVLSVLSPSPLPGDTE